MAWSDFKIWSKSCNKKKNDISGIQNFEILNPLPVPLDEGIKECEVFVSPCDSKIYKSFLNESNPDVIHIHTLMGLHKEFIEAANMLRIRTVFTSHDYFGLCPKVTLFRNDECCDDDNFCEKCIQCNDRALSLKKIQLMQTALYRNLKDNYFVKLMRKKHRSNYFAEEPLPKIMEEIDLRAEAIKYQKLREYYIWIYEHIDFIHFNSTVAENVYKRYISPRESEVISITHNGISDNKNNPRVESEKYRILYLAPAKPFKGFKILKQALDSLWDEGVTDFELRVFSPVKEMSPYMKIRDDGFSQSELPQIFADSDVLIAPSVWYETFGFTVLEALSYGVPVIVSNHVGAKDIIGESGGIFEAGNVDSLKCEILKAKNSSFSGINKQSKNAEIKKWNVFVNEIYSCYK